MAMEVISHCAGRQDPFAVAIKFKGSDQDLTQDGDPIRTGNPCTEKSVQIDKKKTPNKLGEIKRNPHGEIVTKHSILVNSNLVLQNTLYW